ncbi:MAG: ribonuclease P protein component [Desulfobulbus oligotrophicus]|nr:ribonuclease P protein component [Desulfobulbus oligotrophicus]
MGRNTLPKRHLLRVTGEFQAVYKAGARYRGNGLTLIILANDLEYSRLGISVSRKVGNAVRRNRIKRLIRETFRLNRELFPHGADVVWAIRPDFNIDNLLDMKRCAAKALAMQSGRRHVSVRAIKKDI